jgi:hypothetical protein
VHGLREGNGRAQLEFVRELARKNSYWIDWNKVSREELYQASDASFMRGDSTLFEKLLKSGVEPINPDRSYDTTSASSTRRGHTVDIVTNLAVHIRIDLPRRFSELAVFDALLYIRVRGIDERA